jgi:hypothetical protein
VRLPLVALLVLTCSRIVVGQSADPATYKNQLREADDALRRAGEVYDKVNFKQWKAPRSDIDADRKSIEGANSAINFTRGIIERMMSSTGRPSTVDLLNVYDGLMTGSTVLVMLAEHNLRFNSHSPLIHELGAAAALTIQASIGLKRTIANDLAELERHAGTCSPTPTPCMKENSTAPVKQLVFTYECKDTLSGDRIPILVTVNDQIPAEIASGLRQKLRAIPDVEIVYTKNEAALEVSVLGYENRTVGGVRTGYTVSVITTSTCKSSAFGGTVTNAPVQFDITLLNGHRLLTAATASEIVQEAVASVDNEDIEGQRRVRSLIKKATAKH